MNEQKKNPLGTEKISSLLLRFAIPSIIAMVVSALYNMVDQFFIGRNVGELGNAATNISFPLSISCIAIALLFLTRQILFLLPLLIILPLFMGIDGIMYSGPIADGLAGAVAIFMVWNEFRTKPFR